MAYSGGVGLPAAGGRVGPRGGPAFKGAYPWATRVGGAIRPYRAGPWFQPGGPPGYKGVGYPGTPGGKPGAPPPAPGAPPAAPGATAGGVGGAPTQPSPLDATYYLNVGQNQFGTNQKINSLNQQGAYATQDLQAALGRLSYQQPRAELALEQGANNRGGLYSSVYNQQLGNLNYNYLGQQGGLQNQYARGQASRASQIAGLQGGENLYDIGQRYASSQRAAAAAAANPAIGLTSPPASGGTAPTAAPGVAPPAAKVGKGKAGGGKIGTFHVGKPTLIKAPRPTGGVGLPLGRRGGGRRSTGGYGMIGGGG